MSLEARLVSAEPVSAGAEVGATRGLPGGGSVGLAVGGHFLDPLPGASVLGLLALTASPALPLSASEAFPAVESFTTCPSAFQCPDALLRPPSGPVRPRALLHSPSSQLL